jgi:5-methylcytosine-specific restriction endonuclease McrA
MENERVLLLNASYEPIRIISLHRAIYLMFEDKVDVVESRDGEIRSPSISYPKPSIIRLRKYVHIPPGKKDVPMSNRRIFDRDGYQCAYCLTELTHSTATVDHIHPRSKGGKHEWTNVITSCKPCNAKKGNKLLKDLPNYTMHYQPMKPDGNPKRWLIMSPKERGNWEEYLKPYNR